MALAPLPVACDAYPFVANMTLGPLGIDYVHLHYCSLSDVPLLSFSLLFLWLAALFYFLGSTADGYFSPTLASLSDRLRVPHDVAGVTFLAFGNGAPDVFSAIAAYSSGVGETGVNELLGGAMFVSTVVVGGVAVASAVKVQRWAFVRDLGALVASLLLFLLLAMSTSGRERGDTAVAALLFLVMYGIYVGSVVLPACVARYREAGDEIRDAKLTGKASLMISAFWHALSPRGKDARRVKRADQHGHSYAFITRLEAGVDSDKMDDESRKDTCVCWIYAVANELMALLVAVGYITHASNSLLGLTVLAWGNSVGDFITDVSVARAGFPQMAIAGCYGGPVFNILLGLGLPMAYAFVSGRSEDLSLDVHAWISLSFLFVSLISSLLVFRHHEYRCPVWYGKLLMIYYFIYSLLNIAVAFRVVLT
ncbi:hypothetical protein PF005_g810 [Phytophthora fragariae]|uniref:Sodium/calcium exchanger membrane region domain-containing protein n=1 Tax=Phytophthora fragariae TaxID=53985 RepID=A0A6A3ZI82_9STRA|nr:hypothetical protein PF009_g1075 [Phytophthora fragariae]KAE9237065.1 hypothetical protein PF005_g810 [Phytophthora fragariae]